MNELGSISIHLVFRTLEIDERINCVAGIARDQSDGGISICADPIFCPVTYAGICNDARYVLQSNSNGLPDKCYGDITIFAIARHSRKKKDSFMKCEEHDKTMKRDDKIEKFFIILNLIAKVFLSVFSEALSR